MTRAFPQTVNTKTALRSAAQALPDTATVKALLGLDGDCDFAIRATDAYPFLCSKADLLVLIERQQQEELNTMVHSPEYLVLDRRYAVHLPGILHRAEHLSDNMAV